MMNTVQEVVQRSMIMITVSNTAVTATAAVTGLLPCRHQSRTPTPARRRPRCADVWPGSCGRPTAPCSAGWPRWARIWPRRTRSSCASALTRSTWPRRGRRWRTGRGHWAARWTWPSWWSPHWGSSSTPRRTSWSAGRGERGQQMAGSSTARSIWYWGDDCSIQALYLNTTSASPGRW